jgi:hypothetical protein
LRTEAASYSDSGVPLIAAIFPKTSLAAAKVVKIFDDLEAHHVLGCDLHKDKYNRYIRELLQDVVIECSLIVREAKPQMVADCAEQAAPPIAGALATSCVNARWRSQQ